MLILGLQIAKKKYLRTAEETAFHTTTTKKKTKKKNGLTVRSRYMQPNLTHHVSTGG